MAKTKLQKEEADKEVERLRLREERRKARHETRKNNKRKAIEATSKKGNDKDVQVSAESNKKPRKKYTKKVYSRENVAKLNEGKGQISFVKKLVKKMQIRCEDKRVSRRNTSESAYILLDNIRERITAKLIDNGATLFKSSDKVTFSVSFALAAIRLTLPAEYVQKCIQRGTECILKYDSSTEGKNKTTESRTGLTLKVSRVRSSLKKHFDRVGFNSAILLTAAIETILEVNILLCIQYMFETKPQQYAKSGNAKGGLTTLQPRDVMQALTRDIGVSGNHLSNGFAHFYHDNLWVECGASTPAKYVLGDVQA
jgi:hypothetical protein